MLIGGGIAMLSVVTAGGILTNYAWREAQEEEVHAALRAAVAATAHFMRGSLTANEDNIKERVAGVMRGLLDDLIISKDDIVLEHDATTNQTTIRIAGNALYAFKSLWAGGQPISAEPLQTQVTVAFDQSQYEFALALDVSQSMSNAPVGWSRTRLGALQDAIAAIAQTVDDLSTTNPGLISLALVPYANVVNVADTSGTEKTDAKERYVHMLTGARYSTHTSRDTEGHWVDTFHSYGTGQNMGPLASRGLPDFLSTTDWNLHQSGTENISSQIPGVGTWSFEGEDFWNGCVMGRWGAYWNTDARPLIWNPNDADNWPAKKTVDGWEPGSTRIDDLPLHLSDAPPDAADPNTRFTAYSWPDARMGGLADGRLLDVLSTALGISLSPFRFYGRAENHWHLRLVDRGGSLFCPEAPIVPLTDDLTALRAAARYDTVKYHSKWSYGQTFLHLGIVWGLRTLSPLWRDVWKTQSASGDDLPRTPCLEGGTTENCSPFVEKAIVIISDGANSFGPPGRGRIFGGSAPGSPITTNPEPTAPWCPASFNYIGDAVLRAARSSDDSTSFASSFDVDASGRFTASGLEAVLDGFQATHPTVSALDPTVPAEKAMIDAYRAIWGNALRDMTPWQLFWGYDENSPTRGTDATDVLMDPSNGFGYEGRPVRNGLACRPMTPFSAYGRAEELVRVGDGPPVSDVAPFSVPSWAWSSLTADLQDPLTARLDGWLREACDIAGQRGVRIHAIYIGGDTSSFEQASIALLEECVDRGYGGNPRVDEVHVAPTEQALGDAIEDIMDIRRTLRFIDP